MHTNTQPCCVTGELFRKDLIKAKIMHFCIKELMELSDEDNLACLCKVAMNTCMHTHLHDPGMKVYVFQLLLCACIYIYMKVYAFHYVVVYVQRCQLLQTIGKKLEEHDQVCIYVCMYVFMYA